MDVLVVGAGEMGRWFARALASDVDGDLSIAFADADRSAAAAAADETAGEVVADPAAATVAVVALAVPIPAVTDAIETWAPAARDALVDVTGTMTAPVEAMRAHAPDRERTSLHPLFAPANEPGNVAVVTDADGPCSTAIRDALARRGNDLYETTPPEHDDAMATVQTKCHVAILAYALAAEDVPEELHTPISSELDGLVDQVTGGEARVYADIQTAFDGAEDVAAAARRIAEADDATFEALYEQAGQ